jgi:hypothetical protein
VSRCNRASREIHSTHVIIPFSCVVERPLFLFLVLYGCSIQVCKRNLSGIIAQDKRRKFIWEEMSYLERWWRDATETEKADFIHLVKTGQLEIVGGGWVMNDEVAENDTPSFARALLMLCNLLPGPMYSRACIEDRPTNS